MIFSLLGVASLVVMVWGLRTLIAHGGVKGADPSALFSTVFGFAGLALAVILLIAFSSARSSS